MPEIQMEPIRTIQNGASLQLENGYCVRFDENGLLAIKGNGIELFQYPRYLALFKKGDEPSRFELWDSGWVLEIPIANIVQFQELTKLDILEPRDAATIKPYQLDDPMQLKAAISELTAVAEHDLKEGYTDVSVDIKLILSMATLLRNTLN